MTYILVTMPLTIATICVMKVIRIGKVPPLDSILYWPFRSVDFTGSPEQFNSLVDSFIASSKYDVRQRTDTSVYLIEPLLKWKRPGYCFYIVLDAPGIVINIYFKSLVYDDSQACVVINKVLPHFRML